MNKIMLMSFYFIMAIGVTKTTYAENTTEQVQLLNTQIQSQLQKIQASTQTQLKQLNTQIQAQMKQLQSDLQTKMQTLQTQTQTQLKQLQESLQKELTKVHEQVNKGAVTIPQEPQTPNSSGKK